MNKTHIFKFVLLSTLAAGIGFFSSCSKGYLDQNSPRGFAFFWPDAIVTIKTLPSGESFFQLDDSTTLEPVGWKNPYLNKKEIRALVNFSLLDERSQQYSHRVRVMRVDTVRTKPAMLMHVADLPYKDVEPVDIITDWLTVCEDGYVTLHFSAKWGEDADRLHPHLVNLLINPDNPRELEFVHSVNGDRNGTVWRDGIVSFKISDLMPAIKEDEVILPLKWLSYDSQPQKKELKLVYKVRRQ